MTSSDVQVQGSNDWSIASKLSTVTAGYYEDHYIRYFVQKPMKRSALIHRGYYVRAKAMDFVFTKFLSSHPKCQIISFGAGFDSSYFVLRGKGYSSCKYVEIDFPDVVRRKQQLIKSQQQLLELISDSYLLIEADLRDLSSLSKLLLDSKVLDTSVPTLMISECAITYMDEPSSSKLIEWCAKTFTNAVFAVYEQIRPTDGFGRVMQRHFNQLGIPLLSLPVYPDQESQRHRYLQSGWAECQVYDINEFSSHLIPCDELERVRKIELFDEYEGFHEKCAHYIILTAATGSCLTPLPPKEPKMKLSTQPFKKWEMEQSSIQRYGHAACIDSKENLWFSGGFGIRPQGHRRINDLVFKSKNSEELHVKLVDRKFARMHHSMSSIIFKGKCCLLIYGGRTHPGMALSDVGIVRINEEVEVEWIERLETEEWPEPRWRHSAAVLGPTTVFISGGKNQIQVFTDCWILEVSEEPPFKWSRFADLPSRRHSATVVAWTGNVILFGGLDEKESVCARPLIISSIERPEWQYPRWNGPEPKSRYSHQALVCFDRLILIGGVSNAFTPGICVIDLTKWTFCEYSLPEQDIARPVLLAAHTSIIENEEDLTIKCWGGGGLCFSFGTHLNHVSVALTI